MEGYKAGDQLCYYFSKKMWSPVSLLGEEKGPKSVWGHGVRNRKLKHQRLGHLVPGASDWMPLLPWGAGKSEPQTEPGGREMLKRALPKPAGPTPGGQSLGFESPSAPRVLGKGPPAAPRAPLFLEYKVNPRPWILTCWLQHYLSTKGPFSGNEVGIQAWSPDSQKS